MSVLDVLVVASGALGGLVVAVATAGKLFEEARKIRRETENQSKTLERIDEETKPNHGTSMRDAVDRIERAVTQLAERIALNERRDIDGNRRIWDTINAKDNHHG